MVWLSCLMILPLVARLPPNKLPEAMQRFLRWTRFVPYRAHCGVHGVLLLILTGWLGIACGQPAGGVMSTADGQWLRTFDARAQWYERHLGALPDDVVKMRNMVGVWRGGGLLVFPALRLDSGVSAYVTSGLTNTDMPATLLQRSESVEAQHDGRVRFFSLDLKARQPAPVAPGLAGYGYEVLVLLRRGSDPAQTPESTTPAQWPLWVLQWLVTAEIYGDIGLRHRVLQHNGLILHGVNLGDEQRLNLLIVPAPQPLTREMELPGGAATLLLAIAVSEAEVRWAAGNGHEALFARLLASGKKASAVGSPYAGLVSSRHRPDVVEARASHRSRFESDYHD